ncbi:MAG: HD domain-containing phosphohydrolase [Candidatus Eiseniibacteriota bacterium]
MNVTRSEYRTFGFAVLGAGAVTLLLLNTSVPPLVDGPLLSTSALVLWMAMISVAAMSPIPMPGRASAASLMPALDLAAILLFGPGVACWVGVLSRFVGNTAERWNPLVPGLVRLGQAVLAIGAGGAAYTALGGRMGEDVALDWDQLAALAAACGAYLAVNLVVGGCDAAFSGLRASPRRALQYVRESLPQALKLLPFGLLLALTQVRIGPVGVALFLLPLILARYFHRHWVETKRAHVTMVRTLMSAVDAADPHTWGHAYRISKIAVRLGRHLGMPERDVEELEFAALLHDIGRTAIQRDILIKPGRLSEREQRELRTHPRIGAEILGSLPVFPGAGEIVHAHHEQPDGKGYPRGLPASEIPLGSRIIMVVAAFDALTSDRPYRRGLPPRAAFDELNAHSGTQFFPEVVEALSRLYADGTLFDEFELEHLDSYADGRGHSRALEEHLARVKSNRRVPRKRPSAPSDDGILYLDLPGTEAPAVEGVEETILPLAGRGGLRLVIAGTSDVGCQRKNNEDSYGITVAKERGRGCLLVLADGMGGGAAGEVASGLAVATVGQVYEEKNGPRNAKAARAALERAVLAANGAIHERSLADESLAGMGTTLTAASIVGRELVIGHIGDSRAYLIAGTAIHPLTRDHTVAAELAAMGGSHAVSQSASHVLTRALGVGSEVEVDMSARPIRLEPGQTLLLCSDGLSNLVEDEELRTIAGDGRPGDACEFLVELTRARGAPDNVTVVIARLEQA